MALATGSGNGPLLPMQVVHPYPTRWKPIFSKSDNRPLSFRYSVTTLDPGAKLVFTQGFLVRPFSAAFLANNPAPISTEGLEVLVQLVMAAITTEPCPSWNLSPFICTATVLAASPLFISEGIASLNAFLLSVSGTRSCGLRGPAKLGTTLPRSSSSVSVNIGSGDASVRNIPCSLA